MQRPIEKFGYKYKRTDPDKIVYSNWLGSIYLYFYLNSNKFELLTISNTIRIDNFEELQAIYETAKQIKEEYEYENRN